MCRSSGLRRLSPTERPAIAQKGSRVVIDGAVQVEEDVDVDTLYRGYMRK